MLQNGIDKNRLDFIRLRTTKTIERFDCGDHDLNDYILNHAAAFQKYLIAVTYACVDAADAKGRQIGTTLLNIIKSMFVIENKTGCRFLTVDAYLDAVPFYEHCLTRKKNANIGTFSGKNPFYIVSI